MFPKKYSKLIFITFIFALCDFSFLKSHPLSDELAELVEKLSPSVVNVFTVQKPKPQANNQMPFDNIPPQFRDFFKNFPPGFPFGPPKLLRNKLKRLQKSSKNHPPKKM